MNHDNRTASRDSLQKSLRTIVFLPFIAIGLPLSANTQVAPVKTACECQATTISRDFQVTTATVQFASGVQGRLEKIAAAHRGRVGISVRNLDTGETLRVNENAAFPTASTIKVPVMVAALNSLGQKGSPIQSYYQSVALDASSTASGTGFLQNYRLGTKIEVKEMVHLMISVSDNVGTNMLTELLGGPKQVNQWLINHGFRVLRMNATIGGKLVDDPGLRADWGIGVTSPCEMRRLMEMIALSQAGSTSVSEEMLRVLGHQYWDDLILGQVPPMVWAGGKSGALSRSRSDTAIVASPGGRYVIVVYTSENLDRSWEDKNEAHETIRAVSREVWKHFNPQSGYAPPEGMEKF